MPSGGRKGAEERPPICMTSAFPRSVVVLYRNILTAHRKLPAQHRSLGDAYVKEEFRRHRGAEPQFLVPFELQWRDYLREAR